MKLLEWLKSWFRKKEEVKPVIELVKIWADTPRMSDTEFQEALDLLILSEENKLLKREFKTEEYIQWHENYQKTSQYKISDIDNDKLVKMVEGDLNGKNG